MRFVDWVVLVFVAVTTIWNSAVQKRLEKLESQVRQLEREK